MSSIPIAEHALLSDCHSAALITRDGSIDWLCFPRFDSPSVFGRLIGDDAGRWAITAVGEAERTRRYLDGTMVLETTVRTGTGVARLTEAMALDPDEHEHDLGRGAPGAVLREIAGVEGEVEFETEFAPRPEYGLVRPLLIPVDGGFVVRGGAQVLALSFPMSLDTDGASATGRFAVRAGERVRAALHH
ncbi:MAG TPA: trehalase-like domain-containing protein, partial [Actinomycetota bacterium]